MPLVPGAHVGPYEILAPLGAGGMGEVYRGRDARLGREVAIKVLPSEVRDDPERLLRFEREARAAAALNHPHILAVHDVGQHDGLPYIVSELLEGETLRAKLTARPPAGRSGASVSSRRLPERKAVEYATQIARGLAAAHDKGIVHRDLKPENIFLTVDGHLKILDFGLAKLTQPKPALVSSMDTAARETSPGAVLGTVGYMAPEQVRGQPADHRADVFAFGAILYEMLSGRPAFRAESVAETMTAILKEHPPALHTFDPHTAPGLARIVDRCLEKSPNSRFQSTPDLGFALEGLSTQSGVTAAAPTSRRGLRAWLPWALVTVVTVALLGTSVVAIALYRRSREAIRPMRFVVAPPGNVAFSGTANFFAVSPDGRQLAFVAWNASGTPLVWLRALDSLEARPLPGTDGARQPFWSPDSRFIGFSSLGGIIKKVAVSGGPLQTLANDATAVVATGCTWSRDGVILFSSFAGPIRRVSATGGAASPASALDPARRDDVHMFPHFLPDGRRFLYYARSPIPEHNGIYVKALDSDQVRFVVRASSNVAYVSPGYLLYTRDGVLMAQPFDAGRGTTTADPVPVAEGVDQFPETGIAAFSASETGVLVYRGSSNAALSRLLWFDRSGKRLGELGEPRSYRNPRLSPDGTRIAVEIVDASRNRDIWLMDVARGMPVRFTFDPGRDAAPVWSADAQQIAWQGQAAMYVKPSSGTGREERLQSEPSIPDDWLPNGTALLCHPFSPRQIWLLPLVGADRKPRPVVEGRSITTHARLSPDGRWVAFASSDSGRFEIYLQNFPAPVGRWQVSSDGGIQPKWRHDGKELFYVALDGSLMAVPVMLGALAEVGKPAPLFQTQIEPTTGPVWHQYDLTPDGQRFLVNTPEVVTSPVTVLLNWPAVLQQ